MSISALPEGQPAAGALPAKHPTTRASQLINRSKLRATHDSLVQVGEAGLGTCQVTTSVLERWGYSWRWSWHDWAATREATTWKNMLDFPTKTLKDTFDKQKGKYCSQRNIIVLVAATDSPFPPSLIPQRNCKETQIKICNHLSLQQSSFFTIKSSRNLRYAMDARHWFY